MHHVSCGKGKTSPSHRRLYLRLQYSTSSGHEVVIMTIQVYSLLGIKYNQDGFLLTLALPGTG